MSQISAPPPVLRRLLDGLRNVKASGGEWSALCPAHEDHQNSLSIAEGDDGRVLLRCFAGCTVESIVAAVGLEVRDLFPDSQASTSSGLSITIVDLARDKGLPTEFLMSLGLEQRHDGVVVPYLLADGSRASRQRLRTALKAKDGSIWMFGKGKPVPYGLDRLTDARAAGYLILVEGESDCWTLWYHGFPALGIPGADMTSKIEASYLAGIVRLVVVREPGKSGDTFSRGSAKRLRQLGWSGQALVVACGEHKDPNDLHRADPTAFKAAFRSILDAAVPLPPVADQDDVPEQPVEDVDSLLRSTGLSTLGLNPSPDIVERTLRKLKEKLEGEDPLRCASIRNAAIVKLESLGVRSPAKLVDAAIGGAGTGGGEDLQGRTVILSQPTPWPEPVDGSQLLDQIVLVLERYVVLARGAAVAIALWILHAYALAATFISPLLALVSPQRRCGKTTALDVVGALVPRKLPASNISPAALYRTVEMVQPTLLVDEGDTFLANNDDLRGILNAGHTRSTAIVIRTVGDDHEPRQFSTWCPKLIAMIGKLTDTLEDRSIVIPMRRRAPGEKIERLRRDRIDRELEPLRSQAFRWAEDHAKDLADAEPSVPEELHDRAQDNWRPLLAIADAIGGEWPKRAREAALALSGDSDEADPSAAVQLLADIRQLFDQCGDHQIPSDVIVSALNEMEDRPWPEWSKGRPLSKTAMASLLRPFGVRPRTIRYGSETPKGYRLTDFTDAFSRYLPSQPQQPQQAPNEGLFGHFSNRNTPPHVAVAESSEKERDDDVVAGVADRKGEPGEEGVSPPMPAGPSSRNREHFEL
jgi:hypothetical protein